MGYRIEYTPIPNGKTAMDRSFPRLAIMTAAVFTAFVLLVNSRWPQGKEILQDILWPGDAYATQQAIALFTDQLRSGESLSVAAEAFCREILSNADIP